MSKKNKVIPEKIVEAQIFVYLRSKNIVCFKTIQNGYFDPIRKIFRKQTSPFFTRGVSDCLGLLPDGRFLAVEIKSLTGVASPWQKRFIDSVNNSGGLAFIARSVDDVKCQLENL